MTISLINDLIDFIFPKICIITDKKLNQKNSNPFINDFILASFDRTNVNDLTTLKIILISDKAYSAYRFSERSNIQKVIHHIKYQGMKKLGYFMGSLTGKFIMQNNNTINTPDYSIITSVPLYVTKRRERGYNQSDYIARGINSELKITYLEDLLIRVKNTKSQTRLSIKERKENVKNAFIVNKKYKELTANKNIILIDDVVTSGSTLNEATKILKRKGAKSICTLTLAMAVEN